MKTNLLLLVVGVMSAGASAAAADYHVDDDALPPYLGTPAQPFVSIQDGINAAGPGERILVAAGTYAEILYVPVAVVIEGAGASTTIVDGMGSGPILNIGNSSASPPPTGQALIRGLTFRNGRAVNGGAAFVSANATLAAIDCVFEDSSATHLGGAIFVEQGGLVTLNDTVVRNNSARDGGGIASGSIRSSRSQYYGNVGQRGGVIFMDGGNIDSWGDLFHNNAAGMGAVAFARDADVRFWTTVHRHNEAHHTGGVLYGERTSALIHGTLIHDNTATSCGSVHLRGAAPRPTIFASSTAVNNSDRFYSGGLCIYDGATMSIFSSVLAHAGPELQSDPQSAYDVVESVLDDPGPPPPGSLNVNADPKLSATYYVPMAGSPAIDTGSPLYTAFVDVYGAARFSDGDGDGVVVIDRGATEAPRPLRLSLP